MKWSRKFQFCQTSLENEDRSGQPSLNDDLKFVAAVEDLVLPDQQITVDKIVHQVNRNAGSAHNNLQQNQHMTQAAMHCGLQLLMPMQKDSQKKTAVISRKYLQE